MSDAAPSPRSEHLAWCRTRALACLESGDPAGAVASMVSDLGKATTPLYDDDVLQLMIADGMLNRCGEAQIRDWIEGFA